MRVTCRCGATWSGTRVQHCTVCHETFTATRSGDIHRTGDFTGPNPRRCLTPDEMRAKGLEQNDEGQWFEGGRPPPRWAIERMEDE